MASPHKLLLCIVLQCIFVGHFIHCQENVETKEMPACYADSDCLTVGNNTSCVDGRCSCPNGTEIRNNYCLPVVNPVAQSFARACISNSDCGEHHAVCEDNRCKCDIGYIRIRDQCYQVARKGEKSSCIEDQQCNEGYDKNMVCVDNFCQCPTGWANINDKCYQLKGLGGVCNVTQECITEDATCSLHRCTCPNGKVSNSDGTDCLKVVDFQNTCSVSIQCTEGKLGEGAICEGNICVCQEEYHYDPDDHHCYHDRVYGDTCGGDKECRILNLSGMKCVNSKCTCLPGYQLDQETQTCSGGVEISISMVSFVVLMIFHLVV